MRIHLACHYYPPEIGAPQARLSEMAREWAARGHDVTVLTGFPNHPTGVIPPGYRGRAFMKELVDGVRIWRHWLYATPNEGFFKKTLAHLSFAASILLLSLFRGKRPDVLVVSSPNFFAAMSVYLMAAARGVPYVFEVRDLWPGIFIELGVLKNRLLIRALEMIELFLYRRAAAIVPVTHGFAEDMIRRGVAAGKIKVITNGVDLHAYRPASGNGRLRGELGLDGRFVILYLGAHGIAHGLSRVLDAAEGLQGDPGVHFLFVGEGAVKARLTTLAERKSLKNVTFLPGQPRERVASFYRMADVCLVPLRAVDGLSTFIPSKMFEIMGCGDPIIAPLRGEAAAILRRSGAALVIPPEDPPRLMDAVRELKADPRKRGCMGRKGRAFVERNYDRRRLAATYLDLLETVVAATPHENPGDGRHGFHRQTGPSSIEGRGGCPMPRAAGPRCLEYPGAGLRGRLRRPGRPAQPQAGHVRPRHTGQHRFPGLRPRPRHPRGGGNGRGETSGVPQHHGPVHAPERNLEDRSAGGRGRDHEVQTGVDHPAADHDLRGSG